MPAFIPCGVTAATQAPQSLKCDVVGSTNFPRSTDEEKKDEGLAEAHSAELIMPTLRPAGTQKGQNTSSCATMDA
eukprot:2340010-Amphidinium_carterae.1